MVRIGSWIVLLCCLAWTAAWAVPTPPWVYGLSSDPEGAAVYDEAEWNGQTPSHPAQQLGNANGLSFQLKVTASFERVVLIKEGYAPYPLQLDVAKVPATPYELTPVTPYTMMLRYRWAVGGGVLVLLGIVGGVLSLGRRRAVPVAVPLQTLIGQTFDGYRIDEELGEGAFCKVYKAVILSTGEAVAIKLLKMEHLDSQISEAMTRFYRETRVQLQHRNVVLVYGAGDFQGRPYLVLELIVGHTLRALLRPKLAPKLAIAYFHQMLEGLACVHRGGFVHRDLKPENIMVAEDGGLKIMDFGIAKHLDLPAATRSATMIGTPRYMSPEQVDSARVDARSDLYSLGVILFEMLTGEAPFVGAVMEIIVAHIQTRPPRLRDIDPALPIELESLVDRLLQKKPDQRPASAESLLWEVAALRDQLAD